MLFPSPCDSVQHFSIACYLPSLKKKKKLLPFNDVQEPCYCFSLWSRWPFVLKPCHSGNLLKGFPFLPSTQNINFPSWQLGGIALGVLHFARVLQAFIYIYLSCKRAFQKYQSLHISFFRNLWVYPSANSSGSDVVYESLSVQKVYSRHSGSGLMAQFLAFEVILANRLRCLKSFTVYIQDKVNDRSMYTFWIERSSSKKPYHYHQLCVCFWLM